MSIPRYHIQVCISDVEKLHQELCPHENKQIDEDDGFEYCGDCMKYLGYT